MRRFLAVAALLAIIAGFAMVHSSNLLVERTSIGLMAFGTSYLIYLLAVTRPRHDKSKE